MTYKGSNWTRGELGHDIDRNPNIPCEICGRSFGCMEYWKPRWEGFEPDTNESRCDECQERADEMHEKLENNQRITEFIA
jgi:hypothetical protein